MTDAREGPEHFVGAFVATAALDDDALLNQWFLLGETLAVAIECADVGEFDGHCDEDDEQAYFAYGPDAEALFRVMEPHLRSFPGRPARAVLRFGEVDDTAAEEREIQF